MSQAEIATRKFFPGNSRIEGIGTRITEWCWDQRIQTILLALLGLLFVGKAIVPAWSHYGADVPSYYLVARLYRQHRSVERIYEWTWFQRQEDHSAIGPHLVSFIPSTPISALPMVPLTSFSILTAHRVWLGITLSLLSVITILLKRMTGLLGWRAVCIIVLLATNPLHQHFRVGQVHLVVLLLLTIAAWLYFRNHQILSGLTLAAASALKIYPALFLFYFLIKKDWRAVGGLIIGGLGSIVLWIQLFGLDSFRTYAREVLPWGLRGENIDPYNVGWDSLNALLHRLLIAEPELNPHAVVNWPQAYGFLQPLFHLTFLVAFLWAMVPITREASRKKLEWGSYVFLLLLLSSEPLTYHFVALILSTVLIVDYLVSCGRRDLGIMSVLLYTLVCLPYNRFYHQYDPAGWRSLLFFPRLYFMLLFGGFLFWILVSTSAEPFRLQVRSVSFRIATALASALVIASFIQNLHHLSGQFKNYSARVLTVPGSVIATDPVVTAQGTLFTSRVMHPGTLIQDAYAAHYLTHGSVNSLYLGSDSYHPAASARGDIVWVEDAQSNGSRILRFPLEIAVHASAEPTLEVENAEQPVVSSDGKLLAYIREVDGRNSLWIHRLVTSATADSMVAGPEYDVHEAAFFPDDRVIFSSRHARRFRLYEIDRQNAVAREMDAPTCSARYPAVSPDGKWLAYSCEKAGMWHLHTLKLDTDDEVQQTGAECNAFSPAWTLDSESLIYATDCGRGLGMTALAKLNVIK